MSLRLALVSYPIEGGLSPGDFFAKFEAFVRGVRAQGAELVAFPELIAGDLFSNDGDTGAREAADCRRIAAEVTPAFWDRATALSRELGVSLLAGSMPNLRGNDMFNTSLLALPSGECFPQDKLCLTRVEREVWGFSAGRRLEVIDAPWGRTVILICYDCEFPAVSQALVDVKPELILVPSCTGGIEGYHRVRWCSQARAVEHYAFVAGAGTTGPGTKTPNMNTQYGQSVVLTPSDESLPRIAAEGALHDSTPLYAELDFDHLRRRRKVTAVYPARDQASWPSRILLSHRSE